MSFHPPLKFYTHLSQEQRKSIPKYHGETEPFLFQAQSLEPLLWIHRSGQLTNRKEKYSRPPNSQGQIPCFSLNPPCHCPTETHLCSTHLWNEGKNKGAVRSWGSLALQSWVQLGLNVVERLDSHPQGPLTLTWANNKRGPNCCRRGRLKMVFPVGIILRLMLYEHSSAWWLLYYYILIIG